MNPRTLELQGGSLNYRWELTVEQWLEAVDFFADLAGVPDVRHLDGTVFDLQARIEQRMGEVGEPRREIVIEPVPEEKPVEAPKVPVPA